MVYYNDLENKACYKIEAFNIVEKNNVPELWITKSDGVGKKIAVGEEAYLQYAHLSEMINSSAPTLIKTPRGEFTSNYLEIMEEGEEE